MLTLIIDTSQNDSFVAISVNEIITFKKNFDSKDQSKNLLPIIIDILEGNNLTLDTIDLIAVCTGPGRFTSIRIGVVLAKSLSYGSSTPLAHYNSLIGFSTDNSITIIPNKNELCFSLKGSNLNNEKYSIYCEEKSLISTSDIKVVREFIPNCNLIQTSYNLDRIINYLHKTKPIGQKDLKIPYFPMH